MIIINLYRYYKLQLATVPHVKTGTGTFETTKKKKNNYFLSNRDCTLFDSVFLQRLYLIGVKFSFYMRQNNSPFLTTTKMKIHVP